MGNSIMEFRANGDTGLTVILGEAITRATAIRVLRLREAVEAANIPGVRETTPAYCTLLVHYDPLLQNQAALREAIAAIADTIAASGERDSPAEETIPGSRHHTIPVCFADPALAPDLAHLADWAGMETEAVIEAITALRLFVYMIGFAPGLAYMGDLPDALAIPRRKTPIPSAPAGSLLVAGGKALIFPHASPTGWHIIGTTPAETALKDATRPPFSPGDTVAFTPITRKEYDLSRNP